MLGLEKLSAVVFKELSPGGLCIFRIRDKEYVSLVARSSEESLKGQNLVLALAEPDPSKIPTDAPTLFPYPDWGKATCLDLSQVTRISSELLGRSLKTPWELGAAPYGALVVVGQNVYLSALAQIEHRGPIDIFVDVRSGEIAQELRPEPCYIVTHWTIALEGPNGGWAYWIKFDATKTMNLQRA